MRGPGFGGTGSWVCGGPEVRGSGEEADREAGVEGQVGVGGRSEEAQE